MIHINLLKEPHAKFGAPRRGPGKIILISFLVVIAGAAGGALWMFRAVVFRAPAKQPKQEYVVKPEAAPSTYARDYVVEDVVKEVSDTRRKLSSEGILNLPYNELSFSEKINYEVLFAKNVIELLGKAVPAGIGFRSLETDNFQTIYAVGVAPSRELVETVFAALKDANVELLPKPLTLISPNGKAGYKFAVTGKAEFGLNLRDSIMDAPELSNGDLPKVVRAFERTAREQSITLTKGLSRVSAEKVGAYYRHVYQWSGTGSYKNFVKLIVRLYQTRQFCAFKHIAVNASSGSTVTIDSQVLVTTRE
jgi:hypothetical protein